jgi:hypothetical protein
MIHYMVYIFNVVLLIVGCVFFDLICMDEKGSSTDLRSGLLKSLLTFYSSPHSHDPKANLAF